MLYNLFALIYIAGLFLGLFLVFKKAGVAPWKALIPIYNIVVWIKICGKDWKWYIYFLIPAINIFTFLLLVVETAKIFRRNGLLEQTLAVIIPWAYLPYLGLSKKMEYTTPSELPPYKVSQTREWADAIIFALVAAVIIRGNVLEFYNIPSSSMEKSLMTGDYLMVSKMAYGPRVSMTPLSVPLVHNVLPFSNGQVESYLKWIQLPYHRYPGLGKVKRFDATVFNYPDGDTISTVYQSNASYHDLVRKYGRERVLTDKEHFGKIVARPMNKKENFIKRTIGLPGETIEIKDRQVFIDGKAIENPKELQFTYLVRMATSIDAYMQQMASMGMSAQNAAQQKMSEDARLFSSIGISNEDVQMASYYTYLPVTDEQLAVCLKYKEWFNYDVLKDGKNGKIIRLAPEYGLCANDIEYSNRDNEIRTAFSRMGEELKASGMEASLVDNPELVYTLPLTEERVEMLKKSGQVAEVLPVIAFAGYSGMDLFPHAEGYQWSVDNFGPVLIPAKGMTIPINEYSLPIYRRAIEVFEGNKVEVKNHQILINGKVATSYQFKMDYYWLQGDNRHNSADSRYWGFVPEDHIVGKATRVVFSKDKDRLNGKSVRWNRIFLNASKIK